MCVGRTESTEVSKTRLVFGIQLTEQGLVSIFFLDIDWFDFEFLVLITKSFDNQTDFKSDDDLNVWSRILKNKKSLKRNHLPEQYYDGQIEQDRQDVD